MALTGYRQKRSFNKTPEPTGGKPSEDSLIFVIQKHDASHLHYDFRLEMEGVLKSWAVPKGPSTDPAVKRLAMMVEDHPFDYRNFEGIIPKGQYGGGTVIVWDEGTYEPAEGKFKTKKERDKNLLSQLYKGKIVITLKGKKVKGQYALVRSRYQGENSWLLMKVEDKYAKTTDITKKDKSVLSGKTISQMEKEPDRVYGSKLKKVVKETGEDLPPLKLKPLDDKTSGLKQNGDAKANAQRAKASAKLPDSEAKGSKPAQNVKKTSTKQTTAIAAPGKPAPEKRKTVAKKAAKTAAKIAAKSVSDTAAKDSSALPSKTNKAPLLADDSKNETKKVGGKELKFSNLDKIYWPKEGIEKRAVLNYYASVAAYIMPYLKDRPQSLNRHPNGITGQSFYQKNIAGKFPSWIETHDYKNTSKEGEKKFFVCTDEASLLYLANLGCIEINPWHSRVSAPDNPDFCIIDLDPDTNPFEQVIETAQMVRRVLESLDVPSYPKTSGSTGIHIYIPLGGKYDYEQSKMLAELIVNLVHREIPAYTSLERSPSKRKGKIYLDFLQNRSIQTIAAPYSLRPKPGATVSMPVSWDEIKPGLSMSDFHIGNALERIESDPDIFKPVLGKGIVLEKVIAKLEKL
jgi:DNA ligase D-like protein (predicted polymerase)/DNA ligase D-like protein (predicted 3'-phosphoesterase)